MLFRVIGCEAWFTAEAQRLRRGTQSFFEITKHTKRTKQTEWKSSLRNSASPLRLCGEKNSVTYSSRFW
jgi:hypothetical protein